MDELIARDLPDVIERPLLDLMRQRPIRHRSRCQRAQARAITRALNGEHVGTIITAA